MRTSQLRPAFAAALALAALALPAGALAAPSASQITTPASPAYVNSDTDHPGTLHVAGTTSGGDGNVDLRCYSGAASTPLALGVPVNGGSFESDVLLDKATLTQIGYPRPYCVLRAVPAGTTPAAAPGQATPWAGPQVGFGQVYSITLGAGKDPNPADTVHDYFAGQGQPGAYNDFDSVSSCGLCDTYLFAPGTFAKSNPIWWANAGVYPRIPYVSPQTRSALRVDGVDLYAAHGASWLNLGHSTGFPSLSYDRSIDPATGDLTIHERSAFAACAPQPGLYPPTFQSCSAFSSPVVRLARTITTSHEGRQVAIVDSWTSADGQAHDFDAWYDETIDDENHAIAGHESTWNFSWTPDGFKSYPANTQIPVEDSGASTVFVKVDGTTTASGDAADPIGALTYAEPPSAIFLRTPVTANEAVGDWQARYDWTLPAGGMKIVQIYSHAFSLGDVQALVEDAKKETLAPSIALSSPADGASVSTASVTVSGTAAAPDGHPRVSVNGVTAPVAGDGSWSADVALGEGANTITAVVSNSIGLTSEAKLTVSRLTPAPAADPQAPAAPATPAAIAPKIAHCRVPKLRGRTVPKAKALLAHAHCKVGRVTRRRSASIRAGRVVRSKPGAGSIRRAGTRIALTVAKR